MSKSVAFFGASGGCGLSALRHSLIADFYCTALCRNPSRLTTGLSASSPNHGSVPQQKLTIVQGNAHSVDDVARCLVSPIDPLAIVDVIVFSIGSTFSWTTMKADDPNVCEKGTDAMLAALERLRAEGKSGRPRIVVVSSTGISDFERDVPIAFLPLYAAIKNPHVDKKKMERKIKASGEDWTVIRPSLLTDEDEKGKGIRKPKEIRVGVEDLDNGVESKVVGYTITREDVGKWIFQNLVRKPGEGYLRKAVSITY
ncbi:hypothetical protein jhhlp_000125 [Lomentospora prolificans]|uniref:NAD(P)-binding domain-containing protein n=1 Tax=Lomentospora prolificans TaxID=41688 RepID=A0A2N3NLP0_9PEZI|nr:hypothetical protein jhhlp_000125 [Lomentospora prolificans]